MKKTPKLNIFSGPEAVLHPAVTVDVDRIAVNLDGITLLRLRKTDRVELANRQNNRKKWYIRRHAKSGYSVMKNFQSGLVVAVLQDAGDVAATIRKAFGKSKALVGTIETKEEFNGWFAISFLPVEI